MAFYAARQPILDVNKELFAYELLFREGTKNVFPDIGDDEATSKMIDGLQTNLGLDTLAQDKLAFINFTHDTLINKYPLLLPCDTLVVEVLETVRPGKKLLAAVKDLKDNGYTIALDDYIHEPVWKHFYPFTDIIKIDWQEMGIDEIKQVIKDIKPYPHIKLLAEKIETYDDYKTAVDLGFVYFQGYFFSKPEVMTAQSLDASQIALSQLMSEMAEPEPDVSKITQAFEQDVNLSFKLLKYAQSPIFKRAKEIENIKQAIVALGLQELRRFVSLLFTAQVTNPGKPAELTMMSLARARFCEQLAATLKRNEERSSAFLVGLLSLIDAMLDAPLSCLLEQLPLSEPIKKALSERNGQLAQYLEIVEQFEKANWQVVSEQAKGLRLSFDQIGQCFEESLIWADERMQMSA